MTHRPVGWRWRGLVALLALALALGCGGLGCGGSSVPAAGAARAPAGVDEAEPRSQDRPGPALSAFLKAVLAAEMDLASLRWMAAALDALLSEDSQLLDALPAPPEPVHRAFAAFDEWGRSGEPVRWSSYRDDVDAIFFAVNLLEFLAAVVEHSSDPRVAAVLRFAQQLRTADNAKVIGAGSSLAALWAKTLLVRRKEPVTQAFRTYAVTEQDVMAFGRVFVAEALREARLADQEDLLREAFEQGSSAHPQAPRRAGAPRSGVKMYKRLVVERNANGLSLNGYWMDEELLLYTAFWDETELLTANATDPDELYQLIGDRQMMAVASTTSMLIRLTSRDNEGMDRWLLMEMHINEAKLFAELLAKEPASGDAKR